MIREISSKDNPLVKYLQQLGKPAFCRREKLILVEGYRQVEEALQAGLEIKYLLLTPDARANEGWQRIIPWESKLQDQEQLLLSGKIFRQIGQTENPQGIALVCRSPLIEKPGAMPVNKGLYIILEGLQDPGNLGTIVRTADAFAFSGIILTAGSVWPFYDKSLRAAMGSAFHLPIYAFDDVKGACNWLRLSDTIIWAADPAGTSLHEIRRLQSPGEKTRALIIGNEGRGLSEDALKLADQRIMIPMPGKAESLNAAVAAAILAYEMTRATSD